MTLAFGLTTTIGALGPVGRWKPLPRLTNMWSLFLLLMWLVRKSEVLLVWVWFLMLQCIILMAMRILPLILVREEVTEHRCGASGCSRPTSVLVLSRVGEKCITLITGAAVVQRRNPVPLFISGSSALSWASAVQPLITPVAPMASLKRYRSVLPRGNAPFLMAIGLLFASYSSLISLPISVGLPRH